MIRNPDLKKLVESLLADETSKEILQSYLMDADRFVYMPFAKKIEGDWNLDPAEGE